MNILYIALACRPNKGSESRIGWKIPINSAKKNNVYVITNSGNRHDIEKYLRSNPIENLHFIYVEIPKIYSKLSRGVLNSVRLRVLQKAALKKARAFCKTNSIDIIHQITPVEFRSIGNYGSIPDTKFVCGPVGGGEYIPGGLRSYAWRNFHIEFLRRIGNIFSKFYLKATGTIRRCDAVLFANDETKQYIINNKNSVCITEIGIDETEIIGTAMRKEGVETFVFMIAGRLSYRKGHALALDAMKLIPADVDFKCYVIGNGKDEKRLRRKCKKLNLDSKVIFTGRVPFDQMEKYYKQADVLLVPSLRETTGSVILEGMARGLPIITSDRFGGSTLVDDSTGWKYRISSKKETVRNLGSIMHDCILNRDAVKEKENNCYNAVRKYTWDEKIKIYEDVYNSVLPKKC